MSAREPTRPTSIPRAAWSLVPLVAAAIAYTPVLRSYFFADDFHSFVVIADRGAVPFLFEQFGSNPCLVRNAIWLLLHRSFGFEAEPFMWVALLTHLLNVWLLWLTLDRLTRRASLAALGAAWWGASPLHPDTIGWFAVYGHALVGTFVLAVLAHASGVVRRGESLTARMAMCWIALLMLAANSYGAGLGAAVALPVLLLACLPPGASASRPARILLYTAPLIAVLGYLGTRALSQRFFLSMDNLDTFAGSFANPSVLIDQARMLVSLMVVGFGGLLMGQTVPLSIFAGAGTFALYAVVSAAALATISLAARRADPNTRRWMLAQLGVAMVVYGTIAEARGHLSRAFHHTPESMAFQSRYHYAPTISLTVVVVLALAVLVRRESTRIVAPLVVLAVVLQIGAWWARGGLAIPSHSDGRAFVSNARQRIAGLVEAAPAGHSVRITNVPGPPGVATLPGWAGIWLITQATDEIAGHRVTFVEPSRQIRDAYVAPASRRLSALLVAPPPQLGESCELSAVLHALDLSRLLLGCPLDEPAAAACVAALLRRPDVTARGCRCADPNQLTGAASAVTIAMRVAMRCPATPGTNGDTCSRHVLRRLGLLGSALGACHRDALLSRRGVVDPSCVERATARYHRQVSGRNVQCAACPDGRALAAIAPDVVRNLVYDSLCKPAIPAVAYEPANPGATVVPAGTVPPQPIRPK